MPQDFTRRIAIVINKELPTWKAMNTLAHVSAHFGHFLEENYSTDKYFITQDSVNIPRNTQYPIIVFEANQNSLHQFAQDINEAEGVEKMFFMEEMIETTSDKKIQNSLSQKDFKEIEFLGVGIFGENSIVKSLTSGFKLWS